MHQYLSPTRYKVQVTATNKVGEIATEAQVDVIEPLQGKSSCPASLSCRVSITHHCLTFASPIPNPDSLTGFI